MSVSTNASSAARNCRPAGSTPRTSNRAPAPGIRHHEESKGLDHLVQKCHGFRMPRKLRLEYDGAIYHLMNRGDRQEPIFLDDQDRGLFLETLGETCKKTGWQIHAYCLMSNHFHLVVETPRANLVTGMKWF